MVTAGVLPLLTVMTSGPARATTAHHQWHVFPIQGCQTTYSHYHHDYPATDIMAARGCRFVAPVRGVVDDVSRRDRWDPSIDAGATRGGKSVSIIGVDGVRYYGSHLERVNRAIRPGVHVRVGQVLGRVGNTGSARGGPTHLHFGISWPTRQGIWWVRRGEVWPWRFLDYWREGNHRASPWWRVERKRQRVGTVPPCQADC
jgi:murein DD-endopeptidase MepM/ murein hydrolase activator NlpD